MKKTLTAQNGIENVNSDSKKDESTKTKKAVFEDVDTSDEEV